MPGLTASCASTGQPGTCRTSPPTTGRSPAFDPRDTWVVRRTAFRVADAGRWPALGEVVCLTTWCGGTAAASAERRTDFKVEGRLRVEAVALWVSLDGSGRPSRLSKSFHDVYGEAVAPRRVSGRVPATPVPADATTQPWPVRHADLDVVGHVNNAAVWAGGYRGRERARRGGRSHPPRAGGGRSRTDAHDQAGPTVAHRRFRGQGVGRVHVRPERPRLSQLIGRSLSRHRSVALCAGPVFKNSCHFSALPSRLPRTGACLPEWHREARCSPLRLALYAARR